MKCINQMLLALILGLLVLNGNSSLQADPENQKVAAERKKNGAISAGRTPGETGSVFDN